MWNQLQVDISLIIAQVLKAWCYSLFKDVILNMVDKEKKKSLTVPGQFEPAAI